MLTTWCYLWTRVKGSHGTIAMHVHNTRTTTFTQIATKVLSKRLYNVIMLQIQFYNFVHKLQMIIYFVRGQQQNLMQQMLLTIINWDYVNFLSCANKSFVPYDKICAIKLRFPLNHFSFALMFYKTYITISIIIPSNKSHTII